uniref:SPX domain-containing protein n=1 Tax=Pinguiococcus pyrenoidosus TaxID=172671 RepID=A0A7R9YCT0_9STRA|mmetsp:Transcript_3245/g.12989  ORF Transcript_3245/g.12989 Transcript_3245/m.12989 type:complete len:361 (+) Transcript_3245:192-1274(+)
MKFCKNLLEVVDLSHPEWAPFWMDYKTLKKRLKDMSAAKRSGASPKKRGRREVAIAEDALEIQFFSHLMAELRKTEEFYKGAETEFRIRISRVREGVRQLLEPAYRPVEPETSTDDSDSADASHAPVAGGEAVAPENPKRRRALSACVRIYKDLLLLETYAIMSYCAFSKILKKHDKVTGYTTRTQYMSRVVNPKPFTKYKGVVKMLRDCESLFKILTTQTEGPDAELPSPRRRTNKQAGARDALSLSDWSDEMRSKLPLHEEEQLFIDVIRNLNNEATSLMRDEQKEVEEESTQVGLSESESTLSDISSITSSTGADRQRIDSEDSTQTSFRKAASLQQSSFEIGNTKKQTRRKRQKRS